MNDIEADFKANEANLGWSVSIDGKKTVSETYQVLAVMQAPRATGTMVANQTQPPTRRKTFRYTYNCRATKG